MFFFELDSLIAILILEFYRRENTTRIDVVQPRSFIPGGLIVSLASFISAMFMAVFTALSLKALAKKQKVNIIMQ